MPGGATLNLRSFLWRAENVYPNQEIVSRTHEGIQRFTFAEYGERVRKLASALEDFGIERGDRVATFAWNNHWHQEAYYGVASMGAQVHMINLLLPDGHIQHIVDDAQDRVVIVDPVMLEKLEGAYDEGAFSSVELFVVMGDAVPETDLEPVVDYESFIADGDPTYEFPVLPEDQPAGMCYTSGTTGKPKGVEYTQKMYWTQVMALLTSDVGLDAGSVEMPIVPMFHVSGWSLPFGTIAAGAKTVLPGPQPDAEVLATLIEEEGVTHSAGVPTVWMDLLEYATENDVDFSSVDVLVSGGAATPQGLIRDYREQLGLELLSGYGMTETSPVTHLAETKPEFEGLAGEELDALRAHSAGISLPGLEFKVVDDDGEEVPWDDENLGELWVRGPWVTTEYYNAPEKTREVVTEDDWLKTGDVARVNEDGYVDIVDREDDLVKSGGEWIASAEVENVIMGDDDVAEAAVVGVPHDRWNERPVAFVAYRGEVDEESKAQELRERVAESYPKWWAPDAVIPVKEIPKGSTGKFSKTTLREEYVTEDVEAEVAENAPAR
ncbi:Acyl-CoA synthetase (AMP-forming)/AMP-acid ligase II [Halanaeroarchaeum sp. HSR-CO]|uniref:long-chain-fatty-acid--CoA ligase n=1 Tax=Halanaeroarchaeum sp. HSR-CO TaxID=2866382 RepID=UPI00217E42B3|nr:long-chain-fatty-acid--CoA ligase [Halanaeroarchaeum sp. HSR-CO]UWG46753.1 Acyl-CoA synthetase (AMP-forming)/AMP-acid ligase II [Halanaeroarchaeum sp. HSR-CO]